MSIRPIFIVHVIHHLHIGGMENGVVNLINRLPREHFRHAVICVEDSSDFARRIERTDVEIHAMQRSRIGSWRLRWRIFRLLRRLKPDIVHSRNLSGLDALLAARLAGATTVHSEHGFDVDNLHGQALRPKLLRRLHSPLVQHFMCVSKHLQRTMAGQWGVAASRIVQIYNGVDTARFSPARPPRHDLLPSDLRGANLFVIGSVGRVQPIKDQASLLAAFAKVLARHADWRSRLRLAIVGDGPQMAPLQDQARVLGVADQVWFAGARSDVADLLQAMDLFVLPSLNEGISNTLLEAMACGLPVLASAVGGNVELLEPGVVGELFEAGDHDRLGILLERYAADADLCARHGQAARERAVRHFSLEAMMQNYRQMYEAL